jgi:hypothetical protein
MSSPPPAPRAHSLVHCCVHLWCHCLPLCIKQRQASPQLVQLYAQLPAHKADGVWAQPCLCIRGCACQQGGPQVNRCTEPRALVGVHTPTHSLTSLQHQHIHAVALQGGGREGGEEGGAGTHIMHRL